MTYKEKLRFEKIESEIQELEARIEKASAELAAFDFTNINPQKQKKYDEMNSSFNKLETQLETLYAEWEELSAKNK
jgi:archaellum component FlaC